MQPRSTLLLMIALGACAADDQAAFDPSEEMPGGEFATNTLLLGPNSFSRPAEGLTRDEERSFFTGNTLFKDNWVTAPASTTARDGLGPTFNARSCSGCHFMDGRGRPDIDKGELGLLLRLSSGEDAESGAPEPDSDFGGQLQDNAVLNVAPEGRIVITYEEQEGSYEDGETYSLRIPTYAIEDARFELPDGLKVSPRVAPAVIGMGLLEAIPEAALAALADPDDEDGDGISGRINRVYDVQRDAMVVGRFGWKAEQPTVKQQAAGAFLGDMGITSSLFPEQNCPIPQEDCTSSEAGGAPEIDDTLLDKVAIYTSVLAVPMRRNAEAKEVLEGRALFGKLGCDSCHVRGHTTGDSEIAALADQRIWPYTDLLLHDMGDALADGRPVFQASGSEWRTPPLWGLGLTMDVNGHLFLMHDGRARGFAEAILWHGGEGQDAADAFRSLKGTERDALITFLESL